MHPLSEFYRPDKQTNKKTELEEEEESDYDDETSGRDSRELGYQGR